MTAAAYNRGSRIVSREADERMTDDDVKAANAALVESMVQQLRDCVSVGTWDDVDRLKVKLANDSREARRAALVARRAELGTRVVFAQTVDAKGRHLRRFAAYRTDAGADQKVVAYTETYNPNRPAKRKVSLDALHKMAARGEAWETADAAELLVTLDRWREQGAPRKRWVTLKERT